MIQALKDQSSLRALITGNVLNTPTHNATKIPTYLCEDCTASDQDNSSLLVFGTLYGGSHAKELFRFISNSNSTFATIDNLLQTHTKILSNQASDTNLSSEFIIEDIPIKNSEEATQSFSTSFNMSTTLLSTVNIQWGKKYTYTIDEHHYTIVFSNISQYHPAILQAVSMSIPARRRQLKTPFSPIADETVTDSSSKVKPTRGVLKTQDTFATPVGHPRRRLQCDCCGLWPASYCTYEDRLAPKSSALFCDLCYHMLHYSSTGVLTYEHLVLKVQNESSDNI